MNLDQGDAERGLYHKFDIRRVDGSSEAGGRHDGCRYFVIDLDHDPNAREAMRAYAESCRGAYPHLADDIEVWLNRRRLPEELGVGPTASERPQTSPPGGFGAWGSSDPDYPGL